MSNAMKVFLSHKSLDKKLVTDFKETLRLLGFDREHLKVVKTVKSLVDH
jgi:hypothetical protein